MDVPETRYARAPDGTSIAFQIVGTGSVDLVFANGIWSNIELMWDQPLWAHFLNRLASFSRLILLDMRGVGCSDRGPEAPVLELQRDDVAAVMDAAGSTTATIFGVARAATMALLFAATHPERTDALIVYAPIAKTVRADDFPYGRTPREQETFFERFVSEVGTGRNLALQAPTMAANQRFTRWWGRFERLVASPSAYEELGRIFASVDIRAVLPAIHVPTLVLARTDDAIVDAPQARFVAEQIDGARYIELPGIDHVPFIGDADALLDRIEEFVTGMPPAATFDTVLSTILFTDIVDSTATQAMLGDRAWKELVLAHHSVVRDALTRWRGVENDTAGDGFFATFDGAARAIHAAREVTERVRDLGIEVRAGIHAGECEVIDGKIGGLTVSIGARVASNAGPSEVLVSQTVKDLVAGTGLAFQDAGEHELKGIPDRWHLYRVVSEPEQ